MVRMDEFNEFIIRNTDDVNIWKGCAEKTAETREFRDLWRITGKTYGVYSGARMTIHTPSIFLTG